MDRVLWRGTCLELSRQPEEDAYARGICGIFGGDVGNFESAPVAAGINTGIPQWLQLCETFEDALCFLARIFCDNLLLQKVVVKEVTLGDALSRQRFAGRENYTPQTIRMGVNAEAANQWGVQDMYRTLSEWAHSDTNLRDALSDPYSTVQAATLQKDLPTLVETINRLLYSGIYSGAGMASDNNTSLNTSFSYPRRSMHAHRGLAPTPVARTCTRTPNRRAPPTPFLRGAQGLPVVHYLDRAQAQPTQQEGKGVDSVGSGSGRRGDRDEKASRVFPNPLAVLDSTDVVRTDTYNAHTDPPNHVATPTAADGDTHIHTHTHTMDDEIIGHEESAVPTSLAERSPTGTEVYANPNPNLNAVAASSEHALEYVTPSLLRFYAHLAIALSEVHKMKPSALKSVSETAVQSIVSRYVDLLIQQGQHPGLDRSNEIAPLYIERLGSVEQYHQLTTHLPIHCITVPSTNHTLANSLHHSNIS
ncbi:hypothetical protein SARC_03120 [Sphaeroforma arctica JP610]|uniref:Nuclear pore complex protein n=1 Tax=Sphaeroforma arctica JP610 TaxID=667725 RepID=A0A0L0G6W0_9EUKA|nr:hypothetical protein SARC_03120 [Sphaeroforma arctica JP610]KNC84659.1 hypothetical protein SARC_03120 [Sphaeroforma arctica JP610]|eukprot:XP_014158561.1 hypothetical protein SARC_03120 [Sphaeroforma arctica JP610]